MQEDEALMQLIDDFKARVKAVNHKVEHDNYSVLLLGTGTNGTDEPDWKFKLNGEALEAIPKAVDAKIGEDRKILAAEDITVTRTDGKAVEGKFTIGFSGKGFERYKNVNAIVYHVLADGTVEELIPTWDEANKCFKVVTGSCSQFVLAVREGLHTVTVEPAVHGNVIASVSGGYDGDEVVFTFTADKGYQLSKAYLNGEDVTKQLKDGKLATVINGDMTVSAEFVAVSSGTETGDNSNFDCETANPETGDNSNMTLWVTLFAFSSMVLCACLVLGKKRKNVQ